MVRALLALIPLLAMTGPAGSQVAQPPTVTITEANFRITPGVIHLAAGQPVRMVFTNMSGSSHDFSAPAFFGRARILGGMSERGEIDLPGHGQAIVTLVPEKGVYRAHCTHFGHTMMGMKATIVVD